MNRFSTWTTAGLLGVVLTAVPAFGQHHSHSGGSSGHRPGGGGGMPAARPAPAARPTPAMRPTPAARPTPATRPTPAVRPTPATRPTPAVRPTPTVRPTPQVGPTRPNSTNPGPRPQPSNQGTNAQFAATNASFSLNATTVAGLNQAKPNVGPNTLTAINHALAGQPLTAADVSYLKGALEKNPKLNAAEKSAITNALLADATAKGQAQGGHHDHHHHGHHGDYGGGSDGGDGPGGGGETEVVTTGAPGEALVATAAETGAAGNFLTVRYLSVANRTGERLTVYAQTPDREEPWTWTFEPGEKANLSVNGKWLTTDVAWVWAESAKNQWTENKEKAVVLVEQPYEAEAIDTYTYAFNP